MSFDHAPPSNEDLVSTGVDGLDDVLRGGLPRGEMYLLEGEPGTGKTLLAVHFLLAGVAAGETALHISLSQTESDLRRSVCGAGLDLDGVDVHAFTPDTIIGTLEQDQVLFNSGSVELGEVLRALIEVVDRVEPDRVVFDGIGYLRMLASSPVQYRRQLLALRGFFDSRSITVLLTNDTSMSPLRTTDGELRSIVYGAIALSQEPTPYGNERRRLRVMKLRGRAYHAGLHDFRIATGGLRVFPRLGAPENLEPRTPSNLSSGIDELDALLGGGLGRGSSCLFVGPSGTGKTSVCASFASTAAAAGEASALFLFDELPSTFIQRSEALGISVRAPIADGLMRIQHIVTGELSSGEFADLVQREVDARDLKVVLIDSLTGYLSAMPDERLLMTQMHDLLTGLSSQGVLTMLVVAQHGVVGTEIRSPVNVSYLADAVVLLRHFEAQGAVRQAISVFKKRYGPHERLIRELKLEAGGIEVGEPIENFTGVLSGVPRLVPPGETAPGEEDASQQPRPLPASP